MGNEELYVKLACDKKCLPEHVAEIRQQLPMGIVNGALDSGNVLPPALEGCKVVELGCGNGANAFIAAKLVGEGGHVIAIDNDDAVIATAEKNHEAIAQRWGFDNVEFVCADMADLSFIADGSVDVVIANCSISLADDKRHVFDEVYRILAYGGELYFRDLYTDRRPSREFADAAVEEAPILAGALYIEDLRRLMGECGWKNLRYMEFSKEVSVGDTRFFELAGDTRFFTATVRAVKLPDLIEDICEKYGQTVVYNGGIAGMEDGFILDREHTYKTGVESSACGNPAAIVGETRYGKYFTVNGDRTHHDGACCGGVLKGVDLKNPDNSASCCCASSDCCNDEPKKSSSCCGGSVSKNSGSCCCNDSDRDSCCGGKTNGCCDPNAINDDPNLGHKEVVIVDYLYLDQSVCDRCQGTDARVAAAVELVRPVMDMAGYNIVMNKVEIENEYLADRFEFLSSPTVRVNGVDICPEIIENECDCCRTLSSYDVYCRQFDFNGKLYEVPPVAYIVKRLLEIVFHNEKPAYGEYTMPENIRGFLREKYDQSTARPAEPKKPMAAQSSSDCGCGCC